MAMFEEVDVEMRAGNVKLVMDGSTFAADDLDQQISLRCHCVLLADSK